MLTPTKVSTKTECIQRINSLLHSEETTESNSQLTQLTKDNFMNSTDHRVVYKNFDYNTAYDAWIYEGNDKDKIVGVRQKKQFPREETAFYSIRNSFGILYTAKFCKLTLTIICIWCIYNT